MQTEDGYREAKDDEKAAIIAKTFNEIRDSCHTSLRYRNLFLAAAFLILAVLSIFCVGASFRLWAMPEDYETNRLIFTACVLFAAAGICAFICQTKKELASKMLSGKFRVMDCAVEYVVSDCGPGGCGRAYVHSKDDNSCGETVMIPASTVMECQTKAQDGFLLVCCNTSKTKRKQWLFKTDTLLSNEE